MHAEIIMLLISNIFTHTIYYSFNNTVACTKEAASTGVVAPNCQNQKADQET